MTHRSNLCLCFFNCLPHFRYFYCALHSLEPAEDGVRFEVIVFSDADQPLSAEHTSVHSAN